MERIEFDYPAARRRITKRAHIGVVGSGDMEVLMEPRDKWDLVSAVNAALAGELRGTWKLRWRMRLFFLLVKLQGRRPFLPRIRFPSSAVDA